MRKLFLTHFKFRTGELEFEQHRLTVLNQEECPSKRHDQTWEGIATEKATRWFKIHFPESQIIFCMAYQAIENIEGDEETHASMKNWEHAGKIPISGVQDRTKENTYESIHLKPCQLLAKCALSH